MRLSVLAFFLLAVLALNAQEQQTCGMDEIYKETIANNPSVLKNQKLFNEEAQLQTKKTHRKSGAVSIIPVVFHIIHNTGSSNISDAQIEDALRILNEDFRRLNASAANTRDIFKGVAADMEIEFRLARKDPNGNCTNGIVRIFDEETANGSDSIKKKSYWPSDKYLNIWVVDNITNPTFGKIGLSGYAQYPWINRPETDGIVIRHFGLGSIGTSSIKNSKTITHEVGHWLGCLHTFNDGCMVGDSVADTPPCTKRTSFLFCDTSINTCNTDNPDLPDQIENYMDYVIGSCPNMFTIGQKARMDATLINWRPLISTLQNLITTGTDKPVTIANCKPIANFIAIDDKLNTSRTICINSIVSFKDISYNYTGAISYEWIFEGISGASVSIKNPTIGYSKVGSFDVTLIISNANGVDTLTIEDYITVLPAQATNFAPFVLDFENFDFVTSDWTTSGNSSFNYSITDVGAGSVLPDNSNVLFFENNNHTKGSILNLNSPTFNISNVPAPVLSFFYAAALRPMGTLFYTDDGLKVYYSTTCGKNWQELWSKKGKDFSTLISSQPGSDLPFFPSEASKWRQVVIPLAPTISTSEQNNIRFRFQFISNGGNNFFIDGINIGFPASIHSLSLNKNKDLTVYPNPTNGEFTVNFNLDKKTTTKITLVDALGKEIHQLVDGIYNKGMHSISFSSSSLKIRSGLYFIRLISEAEKSYKKIIVVSP